MTFWRLITGIQLGFGRAEKFSLRSLKKLYDTRSSIAHGSVVGTETVQKQNEMERLVRLWLSTAIKILPADNESRKSKLKEMYQVSDKKGVDVLFDSFKAIKNSEVQKSSSAANARKLYCFYAPFLTCWSKNTNIGAKAGTTTST